MRLASHSTCTTKTGPEVATNDNAEDVKSHVKVLAVGARSSGKKYERMQVSPPLRRLNSWLWKLAWTFKLASNLQQNLHLPHSPPLLQNHQDHNRRTDTTDTFEEDVNTSCGRFPGIALPLPYDPTLGWLRLRPHTCSQFRSRITTHSTTSPRRPKSPSSLS